MIKISTKGDYALKALIFLVNNSKNRLKIKDISISMNISESLLRRIIADLDRAGIVNTYKGRNGGVSINKNLNKISVYDVLFAVGEELGISECSYGICSRNVNNCNTYNLYYDLQKSFNSLLKSYILYEIKK